ncbi:MAG: NAD(P)/FAD-dependent oxidoreductase [Acidimicrobiales bacterium]
MELLIIGGGFAGFWAAAAARRVAASPGGVPLRITLVAPEPRLVIRPRLYEAQPEHLAVDLAPLLNELDVTYLSGTAQTLHPGDPDPGADLSVELSDGSCLTADRMVVATGSVMARPNVPGAALAFSVDTQAEAIAFDRRLAEIAAGQRPPSIAVIGAGFTGIELALELRDRLAGYGGTEVADATRIVLVDRADVVGAELGDTPRPLIEQGLADAGIELRLGCTITALNADHVRFADGTDIQAGAVVLTTGLRAAPFGATLPGERDPVGRIVVDAYLRAPAAPKVFVAGDAAAADTGDGHIALQSCQHALQLGRVAGENAARDLAGQPLVTYTQLRYVTCLDLGRSGAVFTDGWDRSVKMSGTEAKQRKLMINRQVIYPPADRVSLLRQSAIDPAQR